ncbi:hypothetical protein BKP35_17155 [Anaerobacillus arseniciselenatis]|uniref:NERD domain-containing protein n=2 Tax=Anaerobacillus arseniciselenatis TaxID=85682 RepID=A0A1S2LA47_9BACI|nr:hypothetical protein BKP35_17155 [Anaerobacillus arseniciselenatis]
MYRYPGQFSRLKRERWTSLKQEWEGSYLNESQTVEKYVEQQTKSIKGAFNKLRSWYKREQRESDLDAFEEQPYQFKYKSLPELKRHFLKELYEFQLNWASSTILEKSALKKAYYFDPTLKWLLQSLPDNYFILYHPIVKYPRATVEFDILLIGPTEVYCIVHLAGTERTIFQTFSERYWLRKDGSQEKKIINPFLSLNRMSTVIKRILDDTEIEMTVRKALVTNEGYIDVNVAWSGAEFLDQRNVKQWEDKLKNNKSPIKSVQLKFSQALLNVCQTTSVSRDPIEEDDGIVQEEEH